MGTRTSGRITTPKAEPMLEDVDYEEEDVQPAQSQPAQRSHASDRYVNISRLNDVDSGG
jgi:hypothetical protein